MHRRGPFAWAARSLGVLWLLLALAGGSQAAIGLERDGGPFVPTPQNVVDVMLDMARVRAGDVVVDLGSGDGRVVLTAARFLRARGMGVDIDAELVAAANEAARKAGVAGRARFIAQDMFKTDLRDATVVTLYVLPAMMARLKPKLLAELRPGARIVSHDFLFEDWPPDAAEVVEAPEKLPINRDGVARLYLWIVPARLAGQWAGTLGGEPLGVEIAQSVRTLSGSVQWQGQRIVLGEAEVQGADVRLVFEHGGVRHALTGRVQGGAIVGAATLAGRSEPAALMLQRTAERRPGSTGGLE